MLGSWPLLPDPRGLSLASLLVWDLQTLSHLQALTCFLPFSTSVLSWSAPLVALGLLVHLPTMRGTAQRTLSGLPGPMGAGLPSARHAVGKDQVWVGAEVEARSQAPLRPQPLACLRTARAREMSSA